MKRGDGNEIKTVLRGQSNTRSHDWHFKLTTIYRYVNFWAWGTSMRRLVCHIEQNLCVISSQKKSFCLFHKFPLLYEFPKFSDGFSESGIKYSTARNSNRSREQEHVTWVISLHKAVAFQSGQNLLQILVCTVALNHDASIENQLVIKPRWPRFWLWIETSRAELKFCFLTWKATRFLMHFDPKCLWPWKPYISFLHQYFEQLTL